jgi:hypothetical protein
VRAEDDAGDDLSVLSYSINEGFGSQTTAKLDPGLGPINSLPLDNAVSGGESGPPWSPDGSQVAVLMAGGGIVLAAFDEGFQGSAHPYDGQLLDLGNVIDCWVDWSPDGQTLYGGSPGACDHVVQLSPARPDAAATLPLTLKGPATMWQLPDLRPEPSPTH